MLLSKDDVLYIRVLAWLRATAMELTDPGVTSANTVQEGWTAALRQVKGGLGAAFAGKSSSRVHSDVYTMLEDSATHEPGFEVNEVRAKHAASLPMEPSTELVCAISNELVH